MDDDEDGSGITCRMCVGKKERRKKSRWDPCDPVSKIGNPEGSGNEEEEKRGMKEGIHGRRIYEEVERERERETAAACDCIAVCQCLNRDGEAKGEREVFGWGILRRTESEMKKELILKEWSSEKRDFTESFMPQLPFFWHNSTEQNQGKERKWQFQLGMLFTRCSLRSFSFFFLSLWTCQRKRGITKLVRKLLHGKEWIVLLDRNSRTKSKRMKSSESERKNSDFRKGNFPFPFSSFHPLSFLQILRRSPSSSLSPLFRTSENFVHHLNLCLFYPTHSFILFWFLPKKLPQLSYREKMKESESWLCFDFLGAKEEEEDSYVAKGRKRRKIKLGANWNFCSRIQFSGFHDALQLGKDGWGERKGAKEPNQVVELRNFSFFFILLYSSPWIASRAPDMRMVYTFIHPSSPSSSRHTRIVHTHSLLVKKRGRIYCVRDDEKEAR